MKNYKWTIGVKHVLVDQIESLNPDNVRIWRDPKEKNMVVAAITRGEFVGIGRAICSTLDRFVLEVGKELALRRALKALKCERTYKPIRTQWESFPGGWKKSQIKRVINAAKASKSGCKSEYIYPVITLTSPNSDLTIFSDESISTGKT